MPKKDIVRFREFLNTLESGGNAFVAFRVDRTTKRVNANFTIRDCHNTAELEFYWSGKGAPKNELAKIEMLERAVREFKEAYLTAVDKRMKYLKRKKKKKAKK